MSTNYTRQSLSNAIWLVNKVCSIPNNKLDASTKMVVVGLVQEFNRCNAPLAHPLKIWYPNVADYCGMSVQTVSSGTSKLVKVHAITKETKKVPGPNNEKRSRTFISFTPEFLTNPESLLAPVPESNYGGKREAIRCPHCGEYHPLRKTETVTCTGCGSVIEELTKSQTLENEAPLPEEYTPEMKQELAALIERTDGLVAAYDAFDEVSSIPDAVLDMLKPGEDVTHVHPSVIAGAMEEYEEMLDLAWDVALNGKSSNRGSATAREYWAKDDKH